MALDALLEVASGAHSNVVTPELLRSSSLGPRDRAFVTELVNGTLRWRRLLDHALAPLSKRPLHDLDAPVLEGLRLGAHQLRIGVRPHAAVSETVDAVAQRAAQARGLVNAVLRRLADQGSWPVPTGGSDRAVGVRTSHPDWIVRGFRESFGPDVAQRILDLDNEAPRMVLRANPARTDASELCRELEAAGGEVVPGRLVPGAVAVSGLGDPAALDAVSAGRATPQDEASQVVAAAVPLPDSGAVLDVAAAPGGKSTALGERVATAGYAEGRAPVVVASDIDGRRLTRVGEAAERLGLGGVARMVADGRQLPFADGAAPVVLVDAPCSGLGVLRRRPEARWRVTHTDIGGMVAVQRRLLDEAERVVSVGGHVVYSVCTLTDEETLGVDAWLAQRHPMLVAVDGVAVDDVVPDAARRGRAASPWMRHGRGVLLLPTAVGSDGMFAIVLRKEQNRQRVA
ncbi:MAG: transcription antitermination factor NusB [Acidimicrobiia bacterium]